MVDSTYETINLMIRKVMEWVIENPTHLSGDKLNQVNEALNTVIGWGDACLSAQVEHFFSFSSWFCSCCVTVPNTLKIQGN